MSRKILIAEDETFIADFYRLELESHDTTVTIVNNGREAIDAMEKEKFDLILLDLQMPLVDGYAVLAYCKKNGIRIPVVVVLTNLGQDINKQRCRELGAEDFILKAENDAPAVWEKVKMYLPVE